MMKSALTLLEELQETQKQDVTRAGIGTEVSPRIIAELESDIKTDIGAKRESTQVSVRLEPEPFWNQAAADALDIIVKAGKPIPHPQIVLAMARREYSKKSAYAAIAFCQGRGWIEHNLVSGYVLSGMGESEDADE